jgi:hypothetical protein
MSLESQIQLHRDPEVAIQMAANAVLHYAKESGVADHKEIQAWWIDRVCEEIRRRLA